MKQPLITRPAYGTQVLAESGLPCGGPSDKGLPLDSDVPGSATFSEPNDKEDVRVFNPHDDGSDYRYRIDNADDLLVDVNRIDVTEDNADKHDGIGNAPGNDWDSSTKTKYPYRNKKPNTKSASAEFVLGLWELSHVPEVHLSSGSIKIALRMDPIMEELNPKFIERAAKCAVSTKRTDKKNLRWVFSVDCGNGPKLVKIKAYRKGNITKVPKMDLDIKCSCPAWRWLGPEYHAKTEDYMDGKPRGTASFPIVRDPTGINKVCKHVRAVLSHMQKWEVPTPKQKMKMR